ncbi:MAG: hypothetical protein ACYC4R_10765 [Anaerolineae bacterium]
MDLILLAVVMMLALTIVDRKAWGDAARRNRRSPARATARWRRQNRTPGLVICPVTQSSAASSGRWWWE